MLTVWKIAAILVIGLLGPGCVGSSSQAVDARVLARGSEVYRLYCLGCHQSDGSGVSDLIPTLVDTDWVSGDEGRLIRLVLEGLEGPIVVNGERFNSVMGAFDYLSDDDVAALLTYLRRSFQNDASAIPARDVAQVRSQLVDSDALE